MADALWRRKFPPLLPKREIYRPNIGGSAFIAASATIDGTGLPGRRWARTNHHLENTLSSASKDKFRFFGRSLLPWLRVLKILPFSGIRIFSGFDGPSNNIETGQKFHAFTFVFRLFLYRLFWEPGWMGKRSKSGSRPLGIYLGFIPA